MEKREALTIGKSPISKEEKRIGKNPELHPGDEKPRLSLSFGILIPKSNQNRVF